MFHIPTFKKNACLYYQDLSLDSAIHTINEKNIFSQNGKTGKEAGNYEIYGIALPHGKILKEVGIISCDNSSTCERGCIGGTGAQEVMQSKTNKLTASFKIKISRMKVFQEAREYFEKKANNEIDCLQLKLSIVDKQLAIRPNLYSDLDFQWLTEKHMDVQFYDYTKIYSRNPRENYFLSYSWDGRESTWLIMEKRLREGQTVTIVTEKGYKEGMTFRGFNCQSGDISDGRFLDYRGKVVVLKKKISRGMKGKDYGILVNS